MFQTETNFSEQSGPETMFLPCHCVGFFLNLAYNFTESVSTQEIADTMLRYLSIPNFRKYPIFLDRVFEFILVIFQNLPFKGTEIFIPKILNPTFISDLLTLTKLNIHLKSLTYSGRLV